LLVELPGLAQEEDMLLASATAHWESHDLTRLESTIHQVLRMQDCVNSWYRDFAQAAPYGATEDPVFIDESLKSNVDRLGGSDRPNPLYTILDCVANTVLARLDGTLLRLSSLRPGVLAAGCADGVFLAGVEARRQKARAAFTIVKSNSSVSAKPLQFGLRQIGFEDWHV
jgi:hypothetical protein